jgi:hypothetical protein
MMNKRNLKDILSYPSLGEYRTKTPTRSWGNLIGEEEKQVEHKAIEQTRKKICKF